MYGWLTYICIKRRMLCWANYVLSNAIYASTTYLMRISGNEVNQSSPKHVSSSKGIWDVSEKFHIQGDEPDTSLDSFWCARSSNRNILQIDEWGRPTCHRACSSDLPTSLLSARELVHQRNPNRGLGLAFPKVIRINVVIDQQKLRYFILISATCSSSMTLSMSTNVSSSHFRRKSNLWYVVESAWSH